MKTLLIALLALTPAAQAAPPCNYGNYVQVMVESGGLCQENVRRLGSSMWTGPVCQDMERARVDALRERGQNWCRNAQLSDRLQRRVDWLNADLSDISDGRHVDMLR
jgi:hypothetical protein